MPVTVDREQRHSSADAVVVMSLDEREWPGSGERDSLPSAFPVGPPPRAEDVSRAKDDPLADSILRCGSHRQLASAFVPKETDTACQSTHSLSAWYTMFAA